MSLYNSVDCNWSILFIFECVKMHWYDKECCKTTKKRINYLNDICLFDVCCCCFCPLQTPKNKQHIKMILLAVLVTWLQSYCIFFLLIKGIVSNDVFTSVQRHYIKRTNTLIIILYSVVGPGFDLTGRGRDFVNGVINHWNRWR